MRVDFSLVGRVILRREVFAREKEKEKGRKACDARIEKARTYEGSEEVRIGSNIVAELGRKIAREQSL